MRKIEFTANLAGKEVEVALYDPHPSGKHWQILVAHYYQGSIIKRDGKWIGYLSPNSILQADDIQLLGERIDQEYPQE